MVVELLPDTMVEDDEDRESPVRLDIPLSGKAYEYMEERDLLDSHTTILTKEGAGDIISAKDTRAFRWNTGGSFRIFQSSWRKTMIAFLKSSTFRKREKEQLPIGSWIAAPSSKRPSAIFT